MAVMEGTNDIAVMATTEGTVVAPVNNVVLTSGRQPNTNTNTNTSNSILVVVLDVAAMEGTNDIAMTGEG
jgi:hypothetical protein